jgi:transcriptional regulator with XRE-family HTH domain
VKTLGQRIAAMRAKKRLTVEQVAVKAGIDTALLSLVEANRCGHDHNSGCLLCDIAIGLDCEAKDLLE